MTDECDLCKQTRELQESHLLQRAAYKHIQDSTIGVKGIPVSIMPRRALITSKQARARFLCRGCEQRFRQKGEDYVSTQFVHRDGQFRLREHLQAASPMCTEAQSTGYDAVRLLGEKIESYLYYAASIFWRAAACRKWR